MELNDKQIKIVQVAEKLFAEKGYDGTSIRKIAEVAGVNLAMISYYFGSKEKLLEALFSHRSQDFRMQAEEAITANKSYLERVDLLVEVMVTKIHNNRALYKILHFESATLTRTSVIQKHLKRKKENYHLIEKFIHQGQTDGVFGKNIHIPLLSSTILGTYFNFYYNQNYFKIIHGWNKNTAIDDFVKNDLTKHIQTTIKALLTYEK